MIPKQDVVIHTIMAGAIEQLDAYSTYSAPSAAWRLKAHAKWKM